MSECPHIDRMPRYKGLPRLFTAIEVDGVVDFATTDMAKWLRCLHGRLCGVCGEPLGDGRFYCIGGPESGRQGAFFDPPMHKDCASWSFDNCPYLTGRTDYISPDRIKLKEQRLERAGGVKIASADVADAPMVSIYSGLKYTFPHRTPTGFCWVIEEGFHIERAQERRRG